MSSMKKSEHVNGRTLKKFQNILTVFLSVLAVIAILGIIYFGIKDKQRTGSEITIVEVLKTEDNNFEEIIIDIGNSDILIKPSIDEKINIKYYQRSTNTYKYTTDSNSIKLIENHNFSIVSCSGVYFEKVQTIISIPADYKGSIDISTTNGIIDISDINNLSVVNLSSSNGKIMINNISTERYVKLSTTNGNVEIINSNFNSYLNIKTTNGQIDIKDNVCAGNIDLKTSNSMVTLARLSAKDLNISTINSPVYCSVVDVKNVEFHIKNGSLNISNIIAQNIIGKATNGSINISIVGLLNDYNIDLVTTNGNLYVNDDSTNGYIDNNSDNSIELKTSNGSIKVNFIK